MNVHLCHDILDHGFPLICRCKCTWFFSVFDHFCDASLIFYFPFLAPTQSNLSKSLLWNYFHRKLNQIISCVACRRSCVARIWASLFSKWPQLPYIMSNFDHVSLHFLHDLPFCSWNKTTVLLGNCGPFDDILFELRIWSLYWFYVGWELHADCSIILDWLTGWVHDKVFNINF